MKKILLLASVFAASTALMAQQKATTPTVPAAVPANWQPKEVKGEVYKTESLQYKRVSAAPIQRSAWFDLSSTIDAVLGGGVSTSTAMNVFPDSTILIAYSDGNGGTYYGGTSIHAIGDVFDPTSIWFDDGIDTTLYVGDDVPYRLDSVGVLFLYDRVTPSVDTIRISVYSSASQVTNSTYRTVWYPPATQIAQNLTGGSDSVLFKLIDWDATNQSFDAATGQVQGIGGLKGDTVRHYDVILDDAFYADTLPNGLSLALAATDNLLPGGMPGNSNIITSVQFIPGYNWTPNVDTLHTSGIGATTKNRAIFLTWKENGAGQPPTYNPGEFNVSYILPTDILYDQLPSTNSFYRKYIPSYAYMGATDGNIDYPYEHHWIIYHLTADEDAVGISENVVKQFSVSPAYPNPAGQSARINYTLSKDAQDVSFVLTNLIGQQVAVLDKGSKAAGEYTVTVDNLDRFKPGIYFYTLTVDGNSITKKLVIGG